MLQSDFSGSSSTLSCINHHHIPLRSFSLTQYKCSCIYTPESTQTVNSYANPSATFDISNAWETENPLREVVSLMVCSAPLIPLGN